MSTDTTTIADVDSLLPGAELRSIREASGRALADVAHEMNMKVWQLDALEKGEYEKLAGPVFVQGYIRSYARLLETDPDPLLRAYSAKQGPGPKPRLEINPPIEESDGNSILLPLMTALVVAALVAAFIIGLNGKGYLGTRFGYVDTTESVDLRPPVLSRPVVDKPSESLSDSIRIPGQSEIPVAVAEESSEPIPKAAAVGTSENKEIEAASLATEVVKPAEKSKEENQPSIVKEVVEPAAPGLSESIKTAPEALREIVDPPRASVTVSQTDPGTGPLRLFFSEDSWVEIRDASGVLLIHGLRDAGFETRLGGQAPYQVFLGNAPGVTIDLDGQNFDTTSFVRQNRTARFLLQQPE